MTLGVGVLQERVDQPWPHRLVRDSDTSPCPVMLFFRVSAVEEEKQYTFLIIASLVNGSRL
jgi:hypothetical protein